MNPILRGYLLALFGIIILSPDALVIRLASDDTLGLAAARGTVGGLLMLLYVCVMTKRGPLSLIRPFWRWIPVISFFTGLGTFAFLYAIAHANTTDVLVIIAFTPILGALFSAVFLKEPVALRTWVAVFVCAIGIAGIFLRGSSNSSLGGLLAAVAAATALAGQFVVLRYNKQHNMVGVAALGHVLSGLLMALWAGGIPWQSFAPAPTWVMCVLVMPVSFALLFLSMRYISAAETGLVMLLESVLGSLWIWWVLGETPTLETVLAGALVLLTLLLHGYFSLRAQRPKPA